MAEPCFHLAARRHLRDAEHLRAAGYQGNADHLSGFAAECAIKGLVVNHLGGRVSEGFPFTGTDVKLSKHIGTWLWNAVAPLASGSPEPEVIALFEGDNPFHDWEVGDRYADESVPTLDALERHMDGAKRALLALEAAALSMNGEL